MGTESFLDAFKKEGPLSQAQAFALDEIHSGRRFSVYFELRALLYLGVALFVAGVGLVIKQYFLQLGPVVIVGVLSLGFMGAWLHCFSKRQPFSRGECVSPHIAFDYILFLGCALYSLDVAYVESHYHLLSALWKNYLLFSAALFFGLAYRFDNRMVLSLALSTLAAWFGFELAGLEIAFREFHRLYAMTYGLIVLGTGVFLSRCLKEHFLNVYLNFAAHFLYVAAVSGVVEQRTFISPYFLLLAVLCGASIAYSLRINQFLFMLYALLYGYVGLSVVMCRSIDNVGAIFLYFIFSSVTLVSLIFFLSRRFRKSE